MESWITFISPSYSRTRTSYAVDPAKLKDVSVWGTVFEGAIYPVRRS
jgi:hypothetical protein